MSDIKQVKRVAEAIIATEDHGEGCRCSSCIRDTQTINQNIEIPT